MLLSYVMDVTLNSMVRINKLLFLATFLYFHIICESANILYVVPFTSKSHYIFLKPIGLELVRRGHNVTVITGHLHKNPPANYHQIEIGNTEIWDTMNIESPNIFELLQWSDEYLHDNLLWKGGLEFTELVLKSKKMQNFLMTESNFDLVIVEQFYNEALYILAHKYNAPLIIVTAYGTCMRHNIMTNHPLQFASLRNEFIVVRDLNSYWGRFKNFYFSMYEYFWYNHLYLLEQEKLALKYVPNLPKSAPSLYDIQRNFSVMLINRHFALEGPVALLPNVVEIGGVQLEYREELPKDIKKILDETSGGIIYMSLGSNINSTEFPKDKLNAFLTVFRIFNKYTVLWKWENETLQNKPDNVIVRPWLPQQDILGHPNIKLFISHGGLMSTEEAIYNGVPLIGIPVYCDQYNNLLYTQNAGFGRILEYDDINENNLETLLSEVLNNNSYTKNAQQASARYKDRPMSPLNLSMYWIEYVIRNNGASFIKNPGLDLSWVAYNMLDVYASIIAIFLLLTYFLRYIFLVLLSKKQKRAMNIKKEN